MDIIKKCDFCDKYAITCGETRMGPLAYMCHDHLQIYGHSSLQGRYKHRKSPAPCPICSKIIKWDFNLNCYYCVDCDHIFF